MGIRLDDWEVTGKRHAVARTLEFPHNVQVSEHTNRTMSWQKSGGENLYAFTLRDSRRLVPGLQRLDPQMHIPNYTWTHDQLRLVMEVPVLPTARNVTEKSCCESFKSR